MLGILCSVIRRSVTTGLSQYFTRKLYVGETPKRKSVSISMNGPSLSEKSVKSAQIVAIFMNLVNFHAIYKGFPIENTCKGNPEKT